MPRDVQTYKKPITGGIIRYDFYTYMSNCSLSAHVNDVLVFNVFGVVADHLWHCIQSAEVPDLCDAQADGSRL